MLLDKVCQFLDLTGGFAYGRTAVAAALAHAVLQIQRLIDILSKERGDFLQLRQSQLLQSLSLSGTLATSLPVTV